MCHHFAGTVASTVGPCIFAVRARTFRLILFYDVGPQHTCRTEFGNFHEIVGADTEIELDFLGSQCGRNAGFHQLVEVFISPSQCISQFLVNVGSGIVQLYRVDGDATEMRISGQCFHQFFSGGDDRTYIFSFLHHFADGVEIQRTFQFFGCITFFLEVSYQQLRQLQGVALAGREIQFDAFATDIFQQRVKVLRIEFFGFNLKSE